MKPSKDTVRLPYIPVNLYKRPDNPHWQYTFRKFSGPGYTRRSTGTSDINKAINIASDGYYKMKSAYENGTYVEKGRGKVKFGNVCQEVIKYINELKEQKSDKYKLIYQDYIWIINRYFTEEKSWDKTKKTKRNLKRMQSCLVTMDITKITRGDLLQFDVERNKFLGRKPSTSTVSQHNACLSFIFDYAILKMKIMDAIQKPEISKQYTTLRKQKPRAFFTLEEAYIDLLLKAQLWMINGDRKKDINIRTIKKEATREIRRLLYAYIGILISTGIRTGFETRNLKWCDIKNKYSEKHQSTYHQLSISGKSKNRTINAFKQIDRYLGILQGLHPDLKDLPDAALFKVKRPIFALPGKDKQPDLSRQFKKLLIDNDMLYDEHGEPRVLYSLRHTALYYLLKEKHWTYEKAGNYLGNTVAVIETFYKDNRFLFDVDDEIEPYYGTRISRFKAKMSGYDVPEDLVNGVD